MRESIKEACEEGMKIGRDEPVAWMIPKIIPYGPHVGNVAWGASTFCDTRNQARVDKNGREHYPYPLGRRDDVLRKAAEKLLGTLDIVCGIHFPGWQTERDFYRFRKELRAELDKP